MKNNDQRSSLFWLAIGLAIAVYSGKYGLGSLSSPGPGFLPLLSGLAIAGLALVVFFQQFSKRDREKIKDLWQTGNWPTMLMVLGALVLYTLLLNFLGFLLDTFLLIAFLLRVIEPLSWKKVFAGAILAAGGAYVIFQLWLKAQLPTGFLGF
jgi:putative tricarboxylic transport membrane protein